MLVVEVRSRRGSAAARFRGGEMGGRRRAGLSTADADKARRAARATTPSRASVSPPQSCRTPSKPRKTHRALASSARPPFHTQTAEKLDVQSARCCAALFAAPWPSPAARRVRGVGRKEGRERGGRGRTQDGSGPRHGLVVLRPRARASPEAPPASEAGRLHAARTVGLRETERPPPAHESSTKPLLMRFSRPYSTRFPGAALPAVVAPPTFVSHTAAAAAAPAPPRDRTTD